MPAFDGIVAEALRAAAMRLGLPARPEWGFNSCAVDKGPVPDGSFHSPWVVQAPCPDCRDLSPALERVVAAFDYEWPGDLLIQRLKLQGRFSCAPMLAGLLAARCDELREQQGEPGLWDASNTLVTAVPASRRSLALRGYNPAGEVARSLARRLALGWRPDLILRFQDGKDQKVLSRRARRLGVQGLYRCASDVTGREVLIVDDVMTTGSTLNAIADVLKAKGATRVWGAVLARTPSR